MADNPFSIPLPPSPLTAASPNINHTNKVFTPEKTTENGQEMINFMHDEDYFDPDDVSGPSNACSDSFSSSSTLMLYPLFKNVIKETKNKSRNSQKLNDCLTGDNLSNQDGDIILANTYSDPSSHPVLLASVHQTNKVKETVSIAGSKSKIGEKLANFGLVDDPGVAGGNTKPSDDGFSAGSLTSSLQKAVQNNKDTEAVFTINNAMRQSHKMTPLLSDDEMLDDWDPNNSDDDTTHSGASHQDSTIGNYKVTTLEASSYVNRRSMDYKGQNQGSEDSSNNSQGKKAPAIHITMVHISNITLGKTPFPHPNTATPQELDSDQTLLMEEEMVLSPAPLQSASKPAAALGTTATNLSSQELHVDLSIRDKWTAVSPRKMRSKKTAESIIPIEGQNNQHPISQEEFEHPQPVSKRISFGLPINNPYSKPKQKQALSLSKKNHSKSLSPASNSPVPQGRNISETPAIPMTQSLLQLSTDGSSPSGSESTSYGKVRSVIKLPLHSQVGLSVIPPSFHALPSIFSNRELPSKQQSWLICKNIHQGRMLPTSFSGKILIGHPVGTPILSEDIKVAITNHHPSVRIFLAKFGISKTINAGILCGSIQQESWQALTNALEAALWDQQEAGSTYTPITVRWDTNYSNGEHPMPTDAMFIKCKIEDISMVTRKLSHLYGSTVADHDLCCPLARFVSMAALKSSESVTVQIIARQRQFLKSTHMANLKSLQPLESILHVPLSTTTMTIAEIFLGLRDSNDDCINHTLFPHGTRKDHTIMASTLSNASHIRSIQTNAITFLQQAYPWIKGSDIFEQQDHRTPLTSEHHELIINQAAHAGKTVEKLFHDWDDFLPYLMMRRA